MKRLLLPSHHTNCSYCVTWTGERIHRRDGKNLRCDMFRVHAGPPNPDWLRQWSRCEKCFPQAVAS